MKLTYKIFITMFLIGTTTYVITKLIRHILSPATIMPIIAAASLAISLMVLYFISNPIKRLENMIEEMSKGNLDVKLDQSLIKRNDEIGSLLKAFDRILISLKIAVNMAGISKGNLKLGEVIEQKKEAEKRLKLTEDFLNNIIENIGIPVIAFNKKGELLIANKKFTEVTGYTREDSINIEKFTANSFPAKMVSDRFIRYIAQFRKGEGVDNFVVPIKCKNGSTIIVISNITSIKDAHGNDNGEAIFMRNISEIFNLEKEIRYWAANGFNQENEKDHHHEIEFSGDRGGKNVKKGKNRN